MTDRKDQDFPPAESLLSEPLTSEDLSPPPAESDKAINKPAKTRSNGVAIAALVLSFIAIGLIILALFAVTMVWPEWQKQQQEFAQFSEEFHSGQQASLSVFEQISTANQNQQLSIVELNSQLADTVLIQQNIQQRLQQLDGHKSNEWLLAEVDYLIRLATRKLWMERDVNGAIALLKSADLRVSELRDPQLLTLRRSLAEDIATLGALPMVDIDGIALTIDGLISQLDALPLNALEIPESVGPQTEADVSNSPSDWRQNLMVSWQKFADGFISFNRLADGTKPLIPPEQRWYLRANIRLTLQQAQLAALRNQPQLYINAINQSDDWLREYFDHNDSAVQYVRETLAELAILPVQVQLPGDLQSRQLLQSITAPSREPEQPEQAAETTTDSNDVESTQPLTDGVMAPELEQVEPLQNELEVQPKLEIEPPAELIEPPEEQAETVTEPVEQIL